MPMLVRLFYLRPSPQPNNSMSSERIEYPGGLADKKVIDSYYSQQEERPSDGPPQVNPESKERERLRDRAMETAPTMEARKQIPFGVDSNVKVAHPQQINFLFSHRVIECPTLRSPPCPTPLRRWNGATPRRRKNCRKPEVRVVTEFFLKIYTPESHT
jgi:hypothetical protein